MPISSTDVSNIIGGQIGMFSASAQYAQAISAQYGFSPHGSPFGPDPRQSQAIGMGGALASGMSRAPGMAMGGLGMMAMFNQAPRMLDPFTGSMHAASMGMRGGGLAGGIGMGLGAMGAYAGIGAAGSWMTNQIATGAQNRTMTMGAVQNVMPNQSMGGLNMMAGQVEGMARQGMGSIRELTGVMQQGAMSGALDTSTLSQFSQSFQKLVGNVRQVAIALNSSITQAQQAMQQVKSIGISSDQAAGFLGTSRAFGATVGISPQQMMGAAAGGSAFARQAGIDRSVGATGAVTQAGIFGMAMKQGMPNILPDSYGRYMQGASRFLMGNKGRAVLGAMMDPHSGDLDPQAAQQIAGGFMSRSDIMSASRENLRGNADMFGSRRGELAASFMSQYGPQGISGALGQMTSNSSRPGMVQQAITGMTRQDLAGMSTLRANTGALQSQLVSAARDGFREGSQQQSFSGALGQAWDQFIKPVKDEFQQLGAQLTKTMQSATQQLMGEFTRSPQLMGTAGAGRQHQREMSRSPQGMYATQFNQYSSPLEQQNFTNADPSDSWSGAIARRLPSAFRFGAYGPGTNISELPGFGMGTDTYSPMQTAMAGATAFAPGGRNIYGWAGHALERGGAGIQALGGTPRSTGFMGMGGIGGPGAALRGGGGLVRGLGYMGKGLGFMSKVAAPAIIGADLLTNAGPAGMRAFGMSPITEGQITGNEARQFQALTNVGALGGEGVGFQDLQVGSMSRGGGVDAAPEGMTPLGGSFTGGSGGRGGTQRFITKQGMRQYHNIVSGSGTKTALKKLQGVDGDTPPQEIVDRVIRNVRSREGWKDGTMADQLQILSEEFKSATGDSRLNTGEIVALVHGKDVLKDEMDAVHEHTDPNVVHNQAMRDIRDGALLQTARLLHRASGEDREGVEASKFNPSTKTAMAEVLTRKMKPGWLGGNSGGQPRIKSLFQSAFGYSDALGAEGKYAMAVGLSQQGIIPAAWVTTQEKWLEGTNWSDIAGHIEQLPADKLGKILFANNESFSRGTGTLDKRFDEAGAAPTKQRAFMQSAAYDMFQGGDNISALHGYQTRHSKANAKGRAGIRDELIGNMQGDWGWGAISESALGKQSDVSVGDMADFLLSEEGWKVSAAGGVADWFAARKDQKKREGTFNREGRGFRGDLAMRASGATGKGLTAYRGIQDEWVKPGKGMESGRVKFTEMLQARLAGGYSGATDSEIAAAAEVGGAMDTGDMQRMFNQLMDSEDPVHRDLANTLGRFMETRNVTRSKGGTKRSFDKILTKYGVKLSREDKKWSRTGKGIMSTDLETDLRIMARQALQAQFPDSAPTDAEVTAHTRDMISAIRNSDTNEWETLVTKSGAPRGVDQGSQGKAGAIKANTTAFVGALDTAARALNIFAGKVPPKPPGE